MTNSILESLASRSDSLLSLNFSTLVLVPKLLTAETALSTLTALLTFPMLVKLRLLTLLFFLRAGDEMLRFGGDFLAGGGCGDLAFFCGDRSLLLDGGELETALLRG